MFYAATTARAFGSVLQLVRIDAKVSENIVTYTGTSLNIGPVCTNLLCLVVYFASVLAYPTTLRNKGIGLILGTTILYAVNIIRLGLLAWAQLIGPKAFDIVHHYLWPAFFIIFGIAMWIWWINYITKKKIREGIFLFIGKFLFYSSITLFVWFMALKYYIRFLVQISGSFLRLIGFKISSAGLRLDHALNLPKEIIFSYRGEEVTMHGVQSIAFNIVPFMALVLAVHGLKRIERLKVVFIGLFILFILHFIRIVIPFSYAFSRHLSIPTPILNTIDLIMAVIPFALWIILLYKKRIFRDKIASSLCSSQ
ncbi:MAG: exosortase/archaeosortase family protein [bacterium]|nr:exosortase/archaeosortase family protein [bacterium]